MTSQRSHTITGVAAATGEMLGVVRVPTPLMANSRRASRERGKSYLIDALAVARAALAEGIETLPTAELAGRSSTSGCWSTIASGWSAPAAFVETAWPRPSSERVDRGRNPGGRRQHDEQRRA
jgi:hypothetical protein